MLATRCEDFQTLFLRTPFQNVDVHVTNAPVSHLKPARLVKVNGVGADQGSPVIIDDVFFICIGNPESCPERKMRPIRRGTHHVGAGKPRPERVGAPASSLAMRVSGGAHIGYPTRAGESPDLSGLRGAARDETSYSSRNCKVKASRHLQYRALNSSPYSRGQAISCRISLGDSSLKFRLQPVFRSQSRKRGTPNTSARPPRRVRSCSEDNASP